MDDASPDAAKSSAYPREWETHAVLADGDTVEIRPIRPSDRAALVDFHGRQSSESIYFRFFRHRPELSDRELDFFTQVDYRSRMAFVAFDDGRLVAVARYETVAGGHAGTGSDTADTTADTATDTAADTTGHTAADTPAGRVAEVAFFVDDANHGRGLATLLLEYLAAAARANGFPAFTASVLPENYRMLSVFRAAGFATRTRFSDGVIEVDIDLTPTTAGRALIDDRLRRSVSRSLSPLLRPSSVAVVGAGHRPGSLGHQLLGNLLGLEEAAPFAGPVLAVNPNHSRVRGVPAFPSMAEASDSLAEGEVVDLALIAVPAEQVLSAVDECGRAGVRGVVVIASRFADGGPVGVERERDLVAVVRKYGMRMIGPSAYGLANTNPAVNLNLLAVPVALPPGSVALASESGVLAAAVIDQFRLAGSGVSQVVGVGEQADVSVADLIGFWGLHDETRVIVVYTEGLSIERSGARSLADAARLTSMNKPIVAVRPADQPSAQLLLESGVILVDAVSELADQAAVMGSQPVPAGPRVAIVSNSASLARLSEAACRRHDLSPVVPAAARSGAGGSILIDDLDRVSEVFGLTVAVSQSGTVEDYERIVVASGVDEGVDAMILALVPTAEIGMAELERLADRVNRSVDKPITVVGLYDRSGVDIQRLPFFTFPEEAARSLARSLAYGRWRETGVEEETAERSDLVDSLLAATDWRRLGLVEEETSALLADFGLPMAPYVAASGLDELLTAAAVIGYPVVLKIDGLSDSIGVSGGTAVDLHDGADLAAAYHRMSEVWGRFMDRALVQQMVPHGVMARLVLERDPVLGPSLAVGFGGSGYDTTEPLDRTFLPTTGQRLNDLVAAYRRRVDERQFSASAADELRELAATMADVGMAQTSVDRLVLDPILVGVDGVVPVDVEIHLARVDADPLEEVRRLE